MPAAEWRMGWRRRADGERGAGQGRVGHLKENVWRLDISDGTYGACYRRTGKGWRRELRENRPGWSAGVPALPQDRGTDGERRTDQGRTASGSGERGECGKECCGVMGAAGRGVITGLSR